MTPTICKKEKVFSSRLQRKRNGFTLLEIMVALGILSMLLGYSFLSVRGSFTRARVERGASRLSFQLQQAKSAALSNNQTVEVSLDTGSNEFSFWVDANRDGVRDAGEVETVLLVDPGPVSMTSTWTSAMFNSYGQFLSRSDQRTITSQRTVFVSDGHKQTVTIRGSGSIRREEA